MFEGRVVLDVRARVVRHYAPFPCVYVSTPLPRSFADTVFQSIKLSVTGGQKCAFCRGCRDRRGDDFSGDFIFRCYIFALKLMGLNRIVIRGDMIRIHWIISQDIFGKTEFFRFCFYSFLTLFERI